MSMFMKKKVSVPSKTAVVEKERYLSDSASSAFSSEEEVSSKKHSKSKKNVAELPTRSSKMALSVKQEPQAQRLALSTKRDVQAQQRQRSTERRESSAAQAPRGQDTPSSEYKVFYNDVLGRGGFGTVYKGYNNKSGEFVAVKETAVEQQRCAAGMLVAEYDLLTRLEHPNIVKVQKLEMLGDKARIVMEWMPSGSVHGIVASTHHRLHENVARRYLKDALKGLAYLHQHKVLHRDMKPANMLVTSNGDVKLSDFGTSKFTLQTQMSTTQHVVGTPAYMSPESIRGKYSEGSDIWALACSFVHMVTGRPPWAHLGPMENIPLMFHIGCAQPPDHHPEIPGHLSEPAQQLLRQCFAQDVATRPTAEALLAMDYFTTEALPPSAEGDETFAMAVQSESEGLSMAHTANDSTSAGNSMHMGMGMGMGQQQYRAAEMATLDTVGSAPVSWMSSGNNDSNSMARAPTHPGPPQSQPPQPPHMQYAQPMPSMASGGSMSSQNVSSSAPTSGAMARQEEIASKPKVMAKSKTKKK